MVPRVTVEMIDEAIGALQALRANVVAGKVAAHIAGASPEASVSAKEAHSAR
jgi:hypothetical protein